MATTTRQVTDFSDFPGKLNKGTGYYELPTLYKVDSMARIRSWKIVVRLIKSDKPRLNGIDWKLLTESQVPIKKTYFKGVVKVSSPFLKATNIFLVIEPS